MNQEMSEKAAPHCISSRKPELQNLILYLKEMMFCLGTLFVLVIIGVSVSVCVLLSKTNNSLVKSSCGGLWEYMLVALLSPIIIPTFYCLYTCLFLMAFPWNWNVFSGTYILTLGIIGLHISISTSENSNCVNALRESTQPVPWLLYASWFKTI